MKLLAWMAKIKALDLKPGDIFLTKNPMALGNAINFVQALTNKDSRSRYTHAGIILNEIGSTLEALWRVEYGSLTKYEGASILIARHSCMNPRTFQKGLDYVREKHLGDFYPIYRLFFMLSPIFGKFSLGKVVCSELVAKFLHRVELFPYYNGCNPDNLHDHVCWGHGWDIVFEGTITK